CPRHIQGAMNMAMMMNSADGDSDGRTSPPLPPSSPPPPPPQSLSDGAKNEPPLPDAEVPAPPSTAPEPTQTQQQKDFREIFALLHEEELTPEQSKAEMELLWRQTLEEAQMEWKQQQQDARKRATEGGDKAATPTRGVATGPRYGSGSGADVGIKRVRQPTPADTEANKMSRVNRFQNRQKSSKNSAADQPDAFAHMNINRPEETPSLQRLGGRCGLVRARTFATWSTKHAGSGPTTRFRFNAAAQACWSSSRWSSPPIARSSFLARSEQLTAFGAGNLTFFLSAMGTNCVLGHGNTTQLVPHPAAGTGLTPSQSTGKEELLVFLDMLSTAQHDLHRGLLGSTGTLSRRGLASEPLSQGIEHPVIRHLPLSKAWLTADVLTIVGARFLTRQNCYSNVSISASSGKTSIEAHTAANSSSSGPLFGLHKETEKDGKRYIRPSCYMDFGAMVKNGHVSNRIRFANAFKPSLPTDSVMNQPTALGTQQSPLKGLVAVTGLLLLDVRDMQYKLRWLGSHDTFSFRTGSTCTVEHDSLQVAADRTHTATVGEPLNIDLDSGWSSFLSRCEAVHSCDLPGPFFHTALARNCSFGQGDTWKSVAQLVVVSNVRVDSFVWTACSLLSVAQRPAICQEPIATAFNRRYAIASDAPPQAWMARPKSRGERELLTFLDLVATSAELHKMVCVEGFELPVGATGEFEPTWFGCASTSHFRSEFIGGEHAPVRYLQQDKAWLTADELRIMNARYLIRQNCRARYTVSYDSVDSSVRITSKTAVNFSSFGLLYDIVIVIDIVLLALHLFSSLELVRWISSAKMNPVRQWIKSIERSVASDISEKFSTRRRQDSDASDGELRQGSLIMRTEPDVGIAVVEEKHMFLFLARSLYRNDKVLLAKLISQVISWLVVLPNSIVWTWSDSTIDKMQAYLTSIRGWVLLLTLTNALWNACVSLNEPRAYAFAKFTFATTIEVVLIIALVAYWLRTTVSAMCEVKWRFEQQRVNDVTTFTPFRLAHGNTFHESLDHLEQTPMSVIWILYGPLMKILTASLVMLIAWLVGKYVWNRTARSRHRRITPKLFTSNQSFRASDGFEDNNIMLVPDESYARMPLEEWLDCPIRAKSLIRNGLIMEVERDGQRFIRPSCYMDFGIMVKHGEVHSRLGYSNAVRPRLRFKEFLKSVIAIIAPLLLDVRDLHYKLRWAIHVCGDGGPFFLTAVATNYALEYVRINRSLLSQRCSRRLTQSFELPAGTIGEFEPTWLGCASASHFRSEVVGGEHVPASRPSTSHNQAFVSIQRTRERRSSAVSLGRAREAGVAVIEETHMFMFLAWSLDRNNKVLLAKLVSQILSWLVVLPNSIVWITDKVQAYLTSIRGWVLLLTLTSTMWNACVSFSEERAYAFAKFTFVLYGPLIELLGTSLGMLIAWLVAKYVWNRSARSRRVVLRRITIKIFSFDRTTMGAWIFDGTDGVTALHQVYERTSLEEWLDCPIRAKSLIHNGLIIEIERRGQRFIRPSCYMDFGIMVKHGEFSASFSQLKSLAAVMLLLLLDVRDVNYKLRWLGSQDSFSFRTGSTCTVENDALRIAPDRTHTATSGAAVTVALDSGWSSFLSRCESLHACGDGWPFFLSAVATNCSLGHHNTSALVAQLVITSSVRVDSLVWTACSLLTIARRPVICQEPIATAFTRRYAIVSDVPPREWMAEPDSTGERELLRFLDLVATSAELHKMVCVEGFELPIGVTGEFEPTWFGCASSSHFRSEFIGGEHGPVRYLQQNKAWLTADEFRFMNAHYLIRQNCRNQYAVGNSGKDGHMFITSQTATNFSSFGLLYNAVIVIDVVLLVLHVVSSLELVRCISSPTMNPVREWVKSIEHSIASDVSHRTATKRNLMQSSEETGGRARRRHSSASLGTALSAGVAIIEEKHMYMFLARSMYRNDKVLFAKLFSQVISWLVVLPNSVVWTWSHSATEKLQAYLTSIRGWVLLLTLTNVLWNACVSFSEERAYAFAKFTFTTTLEIVFIIVLASFWHHRDVAGMCEVKWQMEKQRIYDVTTFTPFRIAHGNTFHESLDYSGDINCVAGCQIHVEPIGTSSNGTQAAHHKPNPELGSGKVENFDDTTGTLMFDEKYARMPLEEWLDCPIRAKSLIRNGLTMEVERGGQRYIRPSCYMDFGIVVKHGEVRSRIGYSSTIGSRMSFDEFVRQSKHQDNRRDVSFQSKRLQRFNSLFVVLILFALDVRDVEYKVRWVGPNDTFSFTCGSTGVLEADPLNLAPDRVHNATVGQSIDVDLDSGWSSFASRCKHVHAFGSDGGPFFLSAMGINCTFGIGSTATVIPQLVMTSDVRVDSLVWATCALLMSSRRPPICHEAITLTFNHRYGFADRVIERRWLAQPYSDGEGELLLFLDMVSTSFPLHKMICIEGFELPVGQTGTFEPTWFGCASPSHFRSEFVGLRHPPIKYLQLDKAWLTADVLIFMTARFLTRQNCFSNFTISYSDTNPSALQITSHTLANFSSSGPLYGLIVIIDILLLSTYLASSLEIVRWMSTPKLQGLKNWAEAVENSTASRRKSTLFQPMRRLTQAVSTLKRINSSVAHRQTSVRVRGAQSADAVGVASSEEKSMFSFFARSMYRNQNIVVASMITQVLSWVLVMPNSVIWTWSSSIKEKGQAYLTSLRSWTLILSHVNGVWSVLVMISERRAYQFTKYAFLTTTELIVIGDLVAWILRADIFGMCEAKWAAENQRMNDVTTFQPFHIAHGNTFQISQDYITTTRWSILWIIFGPLVRILFGSLLAVTLWLLVKYAYYRSTRVRKRMRNKIIVACGQLLHHSRVTSAPPALFMKISRLRPEDDDMDHGEEPYERLPLEAWLDCPIRASSLVRNGLHMETEKGGKRYIRLSCYMDFGIMVKNGEIHSRIGFSGVFKSRMSAEDYMAQAADSPLQNSQKSTRRGWNN
ncbi:TPA: LOW QUALITY PROTEIN: hypothetical protein N0F65_008993, partial [Lagenidium giganteum]